MKDYLMEKEKCLNAIRDYRSHIASFDETVQALNAVSSHEEKMSQRHKSLCWELEVISMFEEESDNVDEINKVFNDIINNIENYEPYSILTLIPLDSCVKVFSEIEINHSDSVGATDFVLSNDRTVILPIEDSEYISLTVFLNKDFMLKEMLESHVPVLDKIDFLPTGDTLYVADCITRHSIPYVSEEPFLRLTLFSTATDVYSLLVTES